MKLALNKRSLALAAVSAALMLAHVVMRGEGLVLLLLAVAAAVVALGLCFRRFSSFSLFLTSLLCCLALAEAVVPFLLSDAAEKTITRYATHYWGLGDLGTQPTEGRFPAAKLGPQGVPIYEVVYTIGSDRFRVTPASAAAANRRVNFLGCSVTFGEGLQDDQTLPYYFAKAVADVQVKNFAFHGYGPQQALAILQSERDTRGQVNVFLTAPWHALRSACKALWTVGSPRYALGQAGDVQRNGVCGDAGGWLPVRVTRWLGQSALYRTAREWLYGRATDADIELYLAVVKQMAQISRARGQRLVVAFLKADESFFQGTSYSNQRVAAALAAQVDELIDVTLVDRAEVIPRQQYLHELDRHPSAEANRERAKLLTERLGPYLAAGSQAKAANRP